MKIQMSKELVDQIDKDIPRTFGEKKVDEEVLTTLRHILIRLDDYVQGTNIFIGKKLLEDEDILLKSWIKLLKPWIKLGNKYVKNVNTLLNQIGNLKKYHLPAVKKDEPVDKYLVRLKSTFPRLAEELESTLFKQLAEKNFDVKKNLSLLVDTLDASWVTLAVGGGNALTNDPQNKEEWRDKTYDTLGRGSGNPKAMLAKLRELFVELISTEGTKIADYITKFR